MQDVREGIYADAFSLLVVAVGLVRLSVHLANLYLADIVLYLPCQRGVLLVYLAHRDRHVIR